DWSNAPEGSNQIAFTAVDLAGNLKTIYLSFTKDITPPSVSFISPSNNSYFNSSFSITTSVSDTYLHMKWYKLDNGATVVFTTASIDLDFLSLGQGPHDVDIFANDTAGNVATVRFSFVKDTVLPNLTVTSPEQGTVFKEAFLLTVDVIDAYYSAMHYFIDNFTNGPTPFDGNSIISGFTPIAQGTHVIYIYAFDLAGNRNGVTLSFVKDTVAPSITINTPAGNGTVVNSAFILGIRVIDAHFSTTWYRIDMEGTDVVFSGNATITGFTGLAQGLHTVYVYANDSVGNTGTRAVTFIKDTEGPVPSFNQAIDQVPYISVGIVEKGTNVKISVLVSDTYSGISSVRVLVNITGSYVSFMMTNQGAGNFTYTVSGGTYQGIRVAYYFSMNDTLGNSRTSSTYTYFIVYDQDVPVVAVDNVVQYAPTVTKGSTISVSSTLRNYDASVTKNVIYAAQIIQPSGKVMNLVFNDTISIIAGSSLGVSLSITLPAGVTGTFTCTVQLKTGWIADGGYTLWVKQFTFVAN
nr:hypothetical protein [Candidatus Sigynarchaeota archaeon]